MGRRHRVRGDAVSHRRVHIRSGGWPVGVAPGARSHPRGHRRDRGEGRVPGDARHPRHSRRICVADPARGGAAGDGDGRSEGVAVRSREGRSRGGRVGRSRRPRARQRETGPRGSGSVLRGGSTRSPSAAASAPPRRPPEPNPAGLPEFSDCDLCPIMVELPSGGFVMDGPKARSGAWGSTGSLGDRSSAGRRSAPACGSSSDTGSRSPSTR